MAGRWCTVACGLLLVSCTREAVLQLTWEPPTLADGAQRIELQVHGDANCERLLQTVEFAPGQSPNVTIAAGDACLQVRAWNEDCEVFATGRTSIEFPSSEERIELVLTASAAFDCRADEVCRADQCLRGDAIGSLTTVAAGRHHTCIVYDSLDVQCVGFNRGGEVGVEDFNGSVVQPTTIAALRGVTGLSLGGRVFDEDGQGGIVADIPIQSGFGCGLSGTTPVCFGSNEDGQLGRNFADREPYPVPMAVSALNDVRQVDVGGSFACAVSNDGAVWCWGRNQSGVVGVAPEETARSLVPVPVAGLNRVVQLAAGHSHACAVTDEGRLFCWGGNYRGELGVSGVSFSPSPREVDLVDIIEVAAGGFHTCARTASGAVYCWGWRQRGQTGPNTTTLFAPSVVIASGAAQVAAGAKFNCARMDNGEVECWGENFYGQLGVGAVDETFRSNPTPQKTQLSNRATDLSCGSHHCCVLLEDGQVACWGRGQYGRLGDGDASSHNVGAPVVMDRN